MKRCCLIILLLLPILAAADTIRERPLRWAQPVISTTISNCFKVSGDVYRAEQPAQKDIPDLKKLKIRTLLNLREYHSDDEVFRHSGLRLMHLPLAAGSLDQADLISALKMLREAEKPVLIHCWHGSDRTGFVVAGYRIVFQSWTREEAIEELRLGGFGYHSDVYPNIIKTLRELDVEAVRKSVLK
jgi:tyrosine-protein phosphatase SIW14